MRYMASIYFSDVLDLVACTVEIHEWSEQYGPPEVVYQETHQWPGLGLTGGPRWLERALIELCADMRADRARREDAARGIGGPHTLSETGDTEI